MASGGNTNRVCVELNVKKWFILKDKCACLDKTTEKGLQAMSEIDNHKNKMEQTQQLKWVMSDNFNIHWRQLFPPSVKKQNLQWTAPENTMSLTELVHSVRGQRRTAPPGPSLRITHKRIETAQLATLAARTSPAGLSVWNPLVGGHAF